MFAVSVISSFLISICGIASSSQKLSFRFILPNFNTSFACFVCKFHFMCHVNLLAINVLILFYKTILVIHLLCTLIYLKIL